MKNDSGKEFVQVKNKRIDEAFPLPMTLESHPWKLSAELPEESKVYQRDKFLLYVNRENFEDLVFM